MKEKEITGVLYKQDKDEPEIITIKNNYKEVQKLVGGLIELVIPEQFDNRDKRIKGLDFYINEEGRLIQGFIPNIILNSKLEGYSNSSILVGNIVVLDRDEEGNFKSIQEDKINPVIECLKELRADLEEEGFLEITLADFEEF